MLLPKRRFLVILSFLVFSLFISIQLVQQFFEPLEDPNQNENLLQSGIQPLDVTGAYEEINALGETTPYQQGLRKIIAATETENSKRLEKIEAVCKKYNLGRYKNSKKPSLIKHPPTPQYSVFYFDTVHKWSLCPIYKAGSSTWLHNMLLLGGMTENDIKTSKRQLSDMVRSLYPELDPTTAEEEFRVSSKILTVRHPFERILSAYRDKLENTNWGREHGSLHFYKAYGSKIVKRYRPGGNKTSTKELLKSGEYFWNPDHPEPAGIEPTFHEFVRFLIDSNLVAVSDDHWIPYYLFCTPCLLQYDFVSKIETFDQDQMYIIRSLGLTDQIQPQWAHKTQFLTEDSTNTVSKVAQVYFKQLTSAQILQLREKYQVDFELFGYEFIPYLQYAKDATSG